ncbi:MAG TPA: hypothetical protein VHA74_00030 [Candidatus Dojkabacteria bacterium]|nr:hypothetical protein [Candidatus Dojkabacteria bacterium]
MNLPNLEQNAYLVIYLKDTFVKANLIYHDFNISRHYVLEDTVDGITKDDINNPHFWSEYIEQLQTLWNWQLFDKGFHHITKFSGEGTGINGAEIIVDERFWEIHKVIETVRTFTLGLPVTPISNASIKDFTSSFQRKYGYEDVMLLDLNFFSIWAYRLAKSQQGIKLVRPHNELEYFSGKVVWTEKDKFIKSVLSPKLKAFLTEEINNEKLADLVANYTYDYTSSIVRNSLKDILRAVLTIEILTLRNDNQGKFDNFGLNSTKNALILTGGLLSNLKLRPLLVAILDGLEVLGDIDIFINTSNDLVPLGNTYINGSIKSKYILSFDDIFKKSIKLIAPNVGKANKERKVIFDANVNVENGENEKHFAFAQEISEINLPKNIRYMLNGKFINANLYDEEKYEISKSSSTWSYDKLVVDGRSKPIVYGPEPKNNKLRMSAWVNEENI